MPYGVGAPLRAGLADRTGISLVEDLPSRLIARLRAGTLDAALVSSIEAFREPGYQAVGGIGICCKGPARSVRAFARRGTDPIASVGLDDASETSSCLLRILLAGPLQTGALAGRLDPGSPPTFERVDPTDTPDALPHDLVMLIGDCGLRADPGGRDVIDLGAAWHEWTGLPFVFALWLVAPHAADRAPELATALTEARRAGVAAEGQDGTGGAIYHDLGAAELEGLARFHREAAVLGLAQADVRPSFVTPGGGSRDWQADTQVGEPRQHAGFAPRSPTQPPHAGNRQQGKDA